MKVLTRVIALVAGAALLVFVAVRFALPRILAPAAGTATLERDLTGAPLPALTGASGWLNGPLPADSLRGRVTLVAVWSDTDPECLRALATLEAWHQAYRRMGVRVVGVHTPDFAFATDPAVPRALVRRLGVTFPVALDPAYRLRARFGTPVAGPRLLLAGADGRVVRVGVGRAALVPLERALRAELAGARAGLAPADDPEAGLPPAGLEAAVAARAVHLGTARVGEGPIRGATPGAPHVFTAQFRYQIEGQPFVPYPVGWWQPGAEGLAAARGGAENFVALRYHGGALWAVASPPAGTSARLWILRDEAWLTPDDLGADARLDGTGGSFVEVDAPRLYEIARARPGEHVVKVSPGVAGLTLHALIVEPGPDGRAP